MKDYIFIFLRFIKKNIFFILLFLAYVIVTYCLHINNCLLKLTIGFPCPGCGMTRACISIMKFNFKDAFMYNPVVFLLPFIFWIIIFKERPIIKKIYNCKAMWIAILLLVIVTYILRLVFVYPNIPMDYFENNLINIVFNK